jgi:hypothetical protein
MTLARAGLGGTVVAGTSATNLSSQAPDLCSRYHTASVYGGTLDVRRSGGGIVRGRHVDFTLLRYDCATHAMANQRVETDSTSAAYTRDAIARAIETATDASIRAGTGR